MARVDLARRAEIGRDRSARTRAELVAAARGLYAARPFDQVTVDDVVAAAGVAKGTFYVHFDSVADLQSVVADDLAREFDEFLQPRRLALTIRSSASPLAVGRSLFRRYATRLGRAGRTQRRHNAAASPASPRKRLKEDIDLAARDGHLGGVTPGLAFDFATAIMLHDDVDSHPQRQLLSRSKHPPSLPAFCARLELRRGKAATMAERAVKQRATPPRRDLDRERNVKIMAVNLVRFASETGPRWGVVRGTKVVPLAAEYATTAALIEHGENDWRNAQAAPLSHSPTLRTALAGHRALPHLLPGRQLSPAHDESGLDPDAKTFNMFFTKSDASIAPAVGTLRRPRARVAARL